MPPYEPLFLGGIASFNRGEYFESHEVWEELWRACQGPEKMFYKGLIQAAVALHHAGRGNRGGAWTLYRRSRCALEPYRPCYLGLDLERFLAELGARLTTSGETNGPRIELSPPEG